VIVVARSEAKQKGLKQYFTGKPCSKGHISNRLVSSKGCKECQRETDRGRYASDPEKYKTKSREQGRKNLPTPTRPCPEVCELCGKKPSGKRGMHLDHDHKENTFRGWLCPTCNTSLGKFGDNEEGLQKVLAYLRNNSVKKELLPTTASERKNIPLSSGVFDYFTSALIEVAKVSFAGNQQHNPGQPLHWSRGKSADHADTMLRHFTERGTRDTDGIRHSAKMVWRALAILQMELESEGAPVARGAK